jgi:hypothetical protein
MTLRRFRNLAAGSVLGVMLFGLGLPLVVADFITSNIYLVQEDDVEDGDVYVASSSARILGTVDGDLIISTGTLTIEGTVTGDVLVLSHGTVRVTGEVRGSLRGAARNVVVEGTVGHDVAVTTVSTRLSGTIDRDVLVFGGSLTMDGQVAGGINGRMISANIDGFVGRDVDIAVGRLTLGPAATVTGDVLYRSGSDAKVAATAEVGSQFERLPSRGGFGTELVLTVATVIGFLGFLFAGFVLLWLFRGTAPRAVAVIEDRPLRTTAIGVAGLIVIPVATLLLTFTLVGVPVAVALAVVFVLTLLFGPVPAVTALGSRLLRKRQVGLFAAFLLGAAIWRAGIWLIPYAGLALYLGALAAGTGGWLVAMRERRSETPPGADLLPRRSSRVEVGNVPSPVGWDAPLAPGSRELSADDGPPGEPEAAD